MKYHDNEIIWYQKYRPRTVDECILPVQMKAIFTKLVKTGKVPNLLLNGPPGIGKTTILLSLFSEIHADYFFVNGSLDGNIDTLRNDISNFVSSVSFSKGKKYVLIDEADNMTVATQKGMRGFIEEFSHNAGFCFITNYKNKLIEPLQSRFSTIDFFIPDNEKQELLKQFVMRLFEILHSEGVDYDQKAVALLAKRYFPNFRKSINELQKYAQLGKIDAGILSAIETNVSQLVAVLRKQKFEDIRKWAAENSVDFADFALNLERELKPHIDGTSLATAIYIINEHDNRNYFVSCKELNLTTMLLKLATECVFV